MLYDTNLDILALRNVKHSANGHIINSTVEKKLVFNWTKLSDRISSLVFSMVCNMIYKVYGSVYIRYSGARLPDRVCLGLGSKIVNRIQSFINAHFACDKIQHVCKLERFTAMPVCEIQAVTLAYGDCQTYAGFPFNVSRDHFINIHTYMILHVYEVQQEMYIKLWFYLRQLRLWTHEGTNPILILLIDQLTTGNKIKK